MQVEARKRTGTVLYFHPFRFRSRRIFLSVSSEYNEHANRSYLYSVYISILFCP